MAKARIRMGLNSLMTSVSEENVNARDSKGWAPIHYMPGCGALKHIEYLVSLGADLNLCSIKAGETKPITPLMVAIKTGEVAAAELLLKLGAISVLEVDAVVAIGELPKDMAVNT